MRDLAHENWASAVNTLAHCWIVTRRDGEVFAFTDHDKQLAFNGLVALPNTGARGAALEKSLGNSEDLTGLIGALDAAAISETSISSGIWDEAKVEAYVLDWSQPEHALHIFSGVIGKVERTSQGYAAEVHGVQRPLRRVVGRTYSRYCDAEVGDSRCGIQINAPPWTISAVVAEIVNPTRLRVSGLESFPEGFFSRGSVMWPSGAPSEIVLHSASGGIATLELFTPAPANASPGLMLSVRVGCEKTLSACKNKFANAANFRGFPYMPGNDALLAQPGPLQKMDGGSRFR